MNKCCFPPLGAVSLETKYQWVLNWCDSRGQKRSYNCYEIAVAAADLEVCEVLKSRYLGPFLRSRLLHFGLTDATLCWNEIGLWVYSGSTQVHNGEVKMMEEKWWFVKSHVLIIIEQFVAVVGLTLFFLNYYTHQCPLIKLRAACS